MARILIGLIASVIAAGGYFGFEFYTQHRIAGEIDAAFDQIRAAGGKVSHGKVSFDLWSRTVGVADIATESAVQPAVAVKIANLTVLGASQPAPERFSADRIEAADVEIAARTPSPAHWQVSYKAPRIVIKNYSSPLTCHSRRLPPRRSKCTASSSSGSPLFPLRRSRLPALPAP
jgi:hypothetical protein